MKFWASLWVMVVITATIVLSGCSDQGMQPALDGGGGNVATVSFVADIQPLFDASCLGCHGMGGNGGLDLRESVAYANMVGVASQGFSQDLVMPGNPEGSVLYLKLIGDPGVGAKMPVGGSWTTSQTDLVRDWITQGALDN